MIELLDDIIEQIADWAGVYGAHRDRDADCKPPDHCCRCCWTSHLKERILDAVEIESALAKGRK